MVKYEQEARMVLAISNGSIGLDVFHTAFAIARSEGIVTVYCSIDKRDTLETYANLACAIEPRQTLKPVQSFLFE